MPTFFSKVFRSRESAAAQSRQNQLQAQQSQHTLARKEPEDAWLRESVSPAEVQELIRACSLEIKSKGISTPFLLLPFRPTSDPSAARSFVRNFFNPPNGSRSRLSGEQLFQELRLTEIMVVSSILKWCWSRLEGGVISWEAYELFRVGEADSSMAWDAFTTFVPISVESDARSTIIFDFFDLLSAVAAHGKHNGLGGRKLARLAGWWAFDHRDTGLGFDGGYSAWSRAADATSHMFFAYLRSLSPHDARGGPGGISTLPISLQTLLESTEYPPVQSQLIHVRSTKVVIEVEQVSPTPFALLRRARNFEYRDYDRVLKALIDFADPVQALTEECKRVLKCIATANHSSVSSFKTSTGIRDATWSRFQDVGFSNALDESDIEEDADGDDLLGITTQSQSLRRRRPEPTEFSSTSRDRYIDIARPTTPSWADFMQSGFGDPDYVSKSPPALLLPPDKVLPPIDTVRARSSQSHRRDLRSSLDRGDLTSVNLADLDDAFWWVWMSSLANEETLARKAAFGRCVLVETVVKGGKWIIVEEKVRGSQPSPEEAILLDKKGKKKSKKGRLSRRKSDRRAVSSLSNRESGDIQHRVFNSGSKMSIAPEQAAKIQSAAAALQERERQRETNSLNQRRLKDDKSAARPTSMFTLHTNLLPEASAAMKWSKGYDKEVVREQYLNGSYGLKKSATPERELPPAPTELHTTLSAVPYEETRTQVSAAPSPPSPPPAPPAPTFEKTLPQPDTRQTEVGFSPKSARTVDSSIQDTKRAPKQSRFKRLFGGGKEPKGGVRSGTPQPISSKDYQGEETLQSVPYISSESKKPESNGNHAWNMPRETRAIDTDNLTRVQHDSHGPSGKAPIDVPHNTSSNNLSRSTSHEERAATKAFSAFDQGPLVDQPAFVPDDESPEPSPVPSPVLSPVIPERTESLTPPQPAFTKQTDNSQASLNSQQSQTSASANPQDRWAQLRKNAAQRAQSKMKLDDNGVAQNREVSVDGETSGEETIESRVARIKARVAELTGNMEDGPAQNRS